MVKTERKRRRNGEGCFYTRKDGRVVYRVLNGTKENGKPHYIEGYGTDENEAYKNYKDKRSGKIKPKRTKTPGTRQAEATTTDSNSIVYFDEYIRFWMDHVKKHEVKPQSLERIREYVEAYIAPYLGHFAVEEVSEELIRSFLDDARCRIGLSYWSVHKIYTHLKACLNFALAKGRIKKHPMILVKHPPKHLFPDNEIQTIPDDVIGMLAKEAVRKYSTGTPVYRHGLSVLLILFTGMRPSEACAAKIKNYDVKTGILRIASTIVRLEDTENQSPDGKKCWKIIDQSILKTAAGKRSIRLNAKARLVAGMLIEQNKKLKTKYLICDKKGGPVHERYVRQTLDKMLKAVGADHYTLYACRHTYASYLFRQGINIKYISRILGHKNVAFTYDTYIHLIEEIEMVSMADDHNVLDDICGDLAIA